MSESDKYREEKDFINNAFGLGDLDHDTALEKGHIYYLMRHFAEHNHKAQLKKDMPNDEKLQEWLDFLDGKGITGMAIAVFLVDINMKSKPPTK